MYDRTWEPGDCWLCDAVGVLVIWLGPISTTEHGSAPLLACAVCVRILEDKVRAYHERRDIPA